MGKYWIKDEKRWYGGCIALDGRTVFNPTEVQLIAAGYEEEEEKPYVPTLEEVKARKIAEIEAYDMSEAVNGFILNGATVWLDKATRVGLMNSLNCEKAAGRTETTLWLDTTALTLNIDLALQLLAGVELYALACYNVTALHKAAVEVLESVEAVETYDHTAGYPERPTINTQSEGV